MQKAPNDGPYPVYGASGIVGFSASYQNEGRYVAVIKDGAGVGRVSLCEPKSSVLGTMQALIPFNDVECDYLLHLVRSMRLGGGFTGSTIPHIYFKDYGKSLIVEHSIVEQRRIADSLNTIEAQMYVLGKQTGKLDELVKSRFVEMFGDPDTNPKSFNVRPGAKLFKIGNGKSRPLSKRFDEGIPAYGGNGISWYTDESLCNHATIVIGRVGRRCGNTRLVTEPCWVTDNAMFIRDFKDDIFNLTFLSWLMEIIGFNRFADKGDLWKITQKPFMEYAFYVPPLSLQQEFAAFVAQVDKLKADTQQAIDKHQLLYDSLAQEYFAVN